MFQAEEICNRLLACLCERSICTKKMENGIAFFSLHNLVKQAIKLFIEEDDDELELIKWVLMVHISIFAPCHISMLIKYIAVQAIRFTATSIFIVFISKSD